MNDVFPHDFPQDNPLHCFKHADVYTANLIGVWNGIHVRILKNTLNSNVRMTLPEFKKLATQARKVMFLLDTYESVRATRLMVIRS